MIAVAFWILVIIVSIWLAVATHWFRWVLGALVVVFLLFVLWIENTESENKKRDEEAKTLIPISQVQFEDLQLQGIQRDSRLIGRVKNNSTTYNLSGLELEISVQDCIEAHCDTVGQATVSPFGLDIPPGQVRGLSESVYFSNLPERRGTYQWNYHVIWVKGMRPHG